MMGIGADKRGRKRKRLTHDLRAKGRPSWSPDGGRIVYWGADEGKFGFFQIYVIGADGRNRKRLTHNRENNWLPAWSADGRTIAYVSAGDGRLIGTIHLMTADGKYLKQLSDVHNGGDYEPHHWPRRTGCVPRFQNYHNLGQVEETRAQPPLICVYLAGL